MKKFSESEQHRIKILLLWITVLGQASIALYLPALPAITHDLGVSAIAIKQTITAFIIGFGVSPIFYGPLSDRYGRKPILLFSLCLASLGYITVFFTHTLSLFLIARILQGLGCGGLLIAGRSIARDVFSGRELASASSYLSMGFAIGFGIAPIIGGFLSTHFPWKTIFLFLLVSALVLLYIVWRLLPETLEKLGNKTTFKKFIFQTFSDYKIMLRHKTFLKFLLGGLFAYGVVITYNVMTPFLIQYTLQLSAAHYGYLALFVGSAYYFGAIANKEWVLKWGIAPISVLGYVLILFAGLAICLLNTLFSPHVAYIILPMMLAIFGQAFIFSNTISGALQQFPTHLAGRASAVFSSLQMILVSGFSATIALLPYNTAIPLGIVLILLSIGCALLLPRKTAE